MTNGDEHEQGKRALSLDDLFQAVGVGRDESRSILEQVKANHARLDGCGGPHDFAPIDPSKKLGRRYRCSKCGGEVESSAYHWYQLGLEHGRKP